MIFGDGNDNTVVVTAVDSITVNGNKNCAGSKTLDGDEAPDISELGSDNR